MASSDDESDTIDQTVRAEVADDYASFAKTGKVYSCPPTQPFCKVSAQTKTSPPGELTRLREEARKYGISACWAGEKRSPRSASTLARKIALAKAGTRFKEATCR